MPLQNWFAATRGFLKSVYERATGFELKRLTVLAVAAFVAYYAIDGRGRTVIAEFRIPQHLQKDLGGVDEKTLTHQLMVELDSIRAVQDAAAKLKISLVKGLEGARLKGDPLRIELSATYNTEYHTLIQSIGTFEWGPVQVPAALILRPFQKLIGQNLLQVSLQRAGDRYMLFASGDSGETWWVTEDEASSDDAGAKGSGDRLVQMLRSLAYKIASPEGAGRHATNTWLGFYHFHEGLRHLVGHFGGGHSSEPNAATVLDNAAREFQRAIALNPGDAKSRFNLILARLERSFYSRETEQSAFYERLLEDVKGLSRDESAWPEERRNLLIAAYIFLGEAYARESRYRDAIGVYEVTLTLLRGEEDLRAYLLNNIGVAYMDAKELERARNFFEKALAEKPRYARPLLNLGNVLMEMRDFRAAERTFGTALEEHAGYPNAFYAMGRFYMKIRDDEVFEKLDQSTRECLRRQARMAITQYVATLEAEEAVRSLSIEEKMDVQRGRGMLDEIGPGEKNGGAKDTRSGPGRCLAGDVRGN